MGLVLSVLVFCVGVIEALSCYHHFQNGVVCYATKLYENTRRNSLFINCNKQRRAKQKANTSDVILEDLFDVRTREITKSQELHLLQLQQQHLQLQLQIVKRQEKENEKVKEKLKKEEKIELVKGLLTRPRPARSISMPSPTKKDLELSKVIDELASDDAVVKEEFDELFESAKTVVQLLEKRPSLSEIALTTESAVEAQRGCLSSVRAKVSFEIDNEKDLAEALHFSEASPHEELLYTQQAVCSVSKDHLSDDEDTLCVELERGKKQDIMIKNEEDKTDEKMLTEDIHVELLPDKSQASCTTTCPPADVGVASTCVAETPTDPDRMVALGVRLEHSEGLELKALPGTNVESLHESDLVIRQSPEVENAVLEFLSSNEPKTEDELQTTEPRADAQDETLEETETSSKPAKLIQAELSDSVKISNFEDINERSIKNETQEYKNVENYQEVTSVPENKQNTDTNNHVARETEDEDTGEFKQVNNFVDVEERIAEPRLTEKTEATQDSDKTTIPDKIASLNVVSKNEKQSSETYKQDDALEHDKTRNENEYIQAHKKEENKKGVETLKAENENVEEIEGTKGNEEERRKEPEGATEILKEKELCRIEDLIDRTTERSKVDNICKVNESEEKRTPVDSQTEGEIGRSNNLGLEVENYEKPSGEKDVGDIPGDLVDITFVENLEDKTKPTETDLEKSGVLETRCEGVTGSVGVELKKVNSLLDILLPEEKVDSKQVFKDVSCVRDTPGDLVDKTLVENLEDKVKPTTTKSDRTETGSEKNEGGETESVSVEIKKVNSQLDISLPEEEVDSEQEVVDVSCNAAHLDSSSNEESSSSEPSIERRGSTKEAFWLIFSGEYTKAMSKDWHSGHFSCWQCDEALTGQRYVLRDDHPYCIKCYESVFANACEECNKTIGIDSKDLSYKDKHWHEACFLCNKCRISLVDKQFGSKADKIYCGNCYDAQFASRCDGCGEIFRAGTKKMEYKTRQWHEKCFCCCVCKTPIGTKSFIPREQEIYCATCYEEKFATRCVKCNKIITSGGVTYKNEPWHRECFTCTNCNTSLAGQRFTSRDEKPYCANCFGELFAKRCTSCSNPITGIGGTRFISFEDRHWHNDCFICASCRNSLVGRGFITDGDDIICPECAKQKLM